MWTLINIQVPVARRPTVPHKCVYPALQPLCPLHKHCTEALRESCRRAQSVRLEIRFGPNKSVQTNNTDQCNLHQGRDI